MIAAVAWTLVCGAMFLLFQKLNRPDPSAGFGHREAEALALEALIREDPERYGDYIVINSASSDVASPNDHRRWVVLCNRADGATPDSAMIVELTRDGGDVLGFRRPGEHHLEPHLP